MVRDRGVSQPLGAMLLVLVAVLLCCLVYTFSVSYFASLQQELTDALRMDRAVHLDTYEVRRSGSSVALTVWLRADRPLRVVYVYVRAGGDVVLAKQVSWQLDETPRPFSLSFSARERCFELILVSDGGAKYAFVMWE